MEDVVLYYKSAEAGNEPEVNSLLLKTEGALKAFPCRVPPVFSPWFPSAGDHWLPIRPSKPAPILSPANVQEGLGNLPAFSTSIIDLPCTFHAETCLDLAPGKQRSIQATHQKNKDVIERHHDLTPASNHGRHRQRLYKDPNTQTKTIPRTPEKLQKIKDGIFITGNSPKPSTQAPLSRLSLANREPQILKDGVNTTEDFGRPDANTQTESTRPLPEQLQPKELEDRHPLSSEGELIRSWSVPVFVQSGGLPQSSQSLSNQFCRVVGSHRLHLHQRAKLVVSDHNCGMAGDIEQVWRQLSRAVRSRKLPTCNANIQRPLAQIWVFCDILYCEHVGKYIKEEFRLTGKITLSVHKLGDIFSF